MFLKSAFYWVLCTWYQNICFINIISFTPHLSNWHIIQPIQPKSHGIIFDFLFAFITNTRCITVPCHLYLQNVYQMQSFLITFITTTLIQATITSFLNECSSLLAGLSSILPPLQPILHRATRSDWSSMVSLTVKSWRPCPSLQGPPCSGICLLHLLNLPTLACPLQPQWPDLYCSSKAPIILHLQVIYIYYSFWLKCSSSLLHSGLY